VMHGTKHDKIKGVGLTFMPNADGVKKGSYHGQIKEAFEKIANVIAPTLTYSDLTSYTNSLN
jgi:hypothetical protein